jgi:hypothetical protein
MIKLTHHRLDTDIHQTTLYTKRLEYDISTLDVELGYNIQREILSVLSSSKNKFVFKKEDSQIISCIRYSETYNLIIGIEFYEHLIYFISPESDDLLVNKYKDFGFILLGRAFGKDIYLSHNITDNNIYLTNDVLLYKGELTYDDLNRNQIKKCFNLKIDDKSEKIIIIQDENDPNYDEWVYYKRKKNISNILNK